MKYEWDALNRMTKAVNTSTGARYVYRADGMRTQKVEGFNLSWTWTDLLHTSGYYDVVTATNLPTTRYFYDGQMAMEDDYTHHVGTADQVDVTRYGLGARGIDRIEKTTDAYGSSPVTNVSYPIYDGHGNMVRTLSRNGSGYAVSAERIFGAWGEVRNGSGPSDSKGRYCADLGHVQDDESGLIYMRARYYEPGLGRFLSQDVRKSGYNWFAFGNSCPTALCDPSGCSGTLLGLTWFFGLVGGGFMMLAIGLMIAGTSPTEIAAAYSCATMANIAFTVSLLTNENTSSSSVVSSVALTIVGETASYFLQKIHLEAVIAESSAGMKTLAASVVALNFAYSMLVLSYIIADTVGEL